MPDTLDDWMTSGRYLPDFMRDFHDQKDLFKMLDEVRERADAKAGGHRSLEAVTWSAAHIYTVDAFLWVMAKHGYTLQRTRKPFTFGNIRETVAASVARWRDQSAAMLRCAFAKSST